MNRTDLATLRAMFDTFVDPILLLDQQARVLRMNESGQRLFTRQARHARLDAVISDEGLNVAVEQALAGQRPEIVVVSWHDKIERTFNVSVAPLAASKIVDSPRVIVTLHDITELRRSGRLLKDFLTNASHELKTPLASLLGFIETLQGPAKGDAAAHERFLAIMHAQASRMSRLVQDLLSLARIEFNEHVVPSARLDLLPLTRSMIEQLEGKAQERKIELRLHAPDNALPKIYGDSDQIQQLLQNLIDNAIKYTLENTPVDVTLDVQGGQIRLSVQDHGAGIAPQHLSRLTERFYRVDAGRSRSMGGTGLGLSIVKHIINRHRGTLNIESQLGQGSTFTVLLPMAD